MSDVFMRNVFKKRECTEYVLQVIMDKKDLKVIDQVLQKDYKNLQGRSAILDCVARDSEGKQMDVEIQQDNEGASPKRARYHSGLMDMNTLNPGQDFDDLPEMTPLQNLEQKPGAKAAPKPAPKPERGTYDYGKSNNGTEMQKTMRNIKY